MEKGGLAAALSAAGITQATQLAWGDEMRIGLYYAHVRRVWAPRGVKVRQPRQMERSWCYLALAVDVRAGTLAWCWVANMKGETLAAAVRHWQAQGCQAVVWDGARGHHAPAVRQVGMTLIQQPPYAPELNPAERVFEELRQAIEGEMYATIEAKVAAVDRELTQLAATPERVRRLTGWHWIHAACQQLPETMLDP